MSTYFGDVIVKTAVPIFTGEDQFDEQYLRDVVANNNRRIAETGDAAPLILGHTGDDDDPNADRPVVGYATNFQYGLFGASKKPAIFADLHCPRDLAESTVRFYPRRSVELYQDSRYIDSIALLGGTTPARELGLCFFSKAKSADLRRFEFNEGYEMDREEILKYVSEAMAADPLRAKFEAACDKLERFMALTEKEEADETAAEEEAVTDAPTEEATSDEAPADEAPADEAPADEVPVADAADDSPVTDDEKDKSKMKMSAAEKVKAERDELARKFSKSEAELAAVKAQNEELVLKFRKTDREKDLAQLQHEGHIFPIVEELELVLPMADEQYAKHLEVIKTRYQRAPIGRGFLPVAAERSADAGSDKARSEAAVKYAKEHKCSFEDAYAAVK